MKILLSMLLAASSCSARADVIPIVWDAAQRFETTAPVAPGKFVEVCGTLARGETVQWSFASAVPLEFNIHYHQDRKVEYPVEPHATAQASGRLVAAVRQDYCWMWSHRGTVAGELVLRLQRTRP